FRIRIRRGRLLSDRATRSLAGACVGAGALATQRQAATVAQAAIGTEVDEPLDRHADFATQVALDRELADRLAQLFHFGLGQVPDLRRRIDPGFDADLLRPRAADAVDALQADP